MESAQSPLSFIGAVLELQGGVVAKNQELAENLTEMLNGIGILKFEHAADAVKFTTTIQSLLKRLGARLVCPSCGAKDSKLLCTTKAKIPFSFRFQHRADGGKYTTHWGKAYLPSLKVVTPLEFDQVKHPAASLKLTDRIEISRRVIENLLSCEFPEWESSGVLSLHRQFLEGEENMEVGSELRRSLSRLEKKGLLAFDAQEESKLVLSQTMTNLAQDLKHILENAN